VSQASTQTITVILIIITFPVGTPLSTPGQEVAVKPPCTQTEPASNADQNA